MEICDLVALEKPEGKKAISGGTQYSARFDNNHIARYPYILKITRKRQKNLRRILFSYNLLILNPNIWSDQVLLEHTSILQRLVLNRLGSRCNFWLALNWSGSRTLHGSPPTELIVFIYLFIYLFTLNPLKVSVLGFQPKESTGTSCCGKSWKSEYVVLV